MSYEGNWRDVDRRLVTHALMQTRVAIFLHTGVPYTFDGLVFKANPYLRKYYGYTSAGGKQIAFKPGKISVPLVIHELGHSFNDRQPAMRPYKRLYYEGIRTADGVNILGRGAPRNGFESDDYGYRQHPAHWDAEFSYLEDFCDMFMLWVMGRLPESEAGRARQSWMDSHMKEWNRNTIENDGG